jgi:hypothetical protein
MGADVGQRPHAGAAGLYRVPELSNRADGLYRLLGVPTHIVGATLSRDKFAGGAPLLSSPVLAPSLGIRLHSHQGAMRI